MKMVLGLLFNKCTVTASNITPKLNKQRTLACGTLSYLQGCRDVWFGCCRCDLRQSYVDWNAIVVECGGLQDYTGRAYEHRQCKYPQKKSVQHHGYILPIFFDLETKQNKYYEIKTNIKNKLYSLIEYVA